MGWFRALSVGSLVLLWNFAILPSFANTPEMDVPVEEFRENALDFHSVAPDAEPASLSEGPTGDPNGVSVPEKKEIQVDEDDRLCADLMVMAFHFYLQEKNGQPIDMTAPTTRNTWSSSELHHAVNDDRWNSWAFKFFRGVTGVKWLPWRSGLKGKSLMGLVALNRSENKMVLAFRGTQELKEWVGNNFNVFGAESDFPGLEEPVHAGYWNIFQSVREEMHNQVLGFLNTMRAEEREKLQFLVTGHSLGAAVGTFASAFYSDQKDLIPLGVDLRTFGSPRVGGEEFKTWFTQRVRGKRFVRETDPMTTLAPDFLGYKNVLDEVILPSYGAKKYQFNTAHDVRLYQKAVYEKLGLEYTEMYTKE